MTVALALMIRGMTDASTAHTLDLQVGGQRGRRIVRRAHPTGPDGVVIAFRRSNRARLERQVLDRIPEHAQATVLAETFNGPSPPWAALSSRWFPSWRRK